MPVLNRVFLVGNLTRDPEGLRRTPSGMVVLYMRMALNTKTRTPDGEVREEQCFVDVSVWGHEAEIAAGKLSKGSLVLVNGRLWSEGAGKDDRKQIRLSVVAERIEILGDSKRMG
ncbi:MAG: single-stranded DNA-binding protein [bacterium]